MRTDAGSVATQPTLARRLLPVAGLGLVGVASLLWQPLSPAVRDALPEGIAESPAALRALLLLNPLLLVMALALVGAVLAHRVGLGSWVAGTLRPGPRGAWVRVAAWAAALGGVLGALLVVTDAALRPWLGDAGASLVAGASPGVATIAVGVLYGGLAEEVMLRWGLMSAIAWGFARMAQAWRGTASMHVTPLIAGMATAVAAIVFAAAHLPALAAIVEPSPALVARTLALNSVAGMVYGALAWRRGLEAAMLAHGATHLGMAAARVPFS